MKDYKYCMKSLKHKKSFWVKIQCLFGLHEWESSEIHEGTFCEVTSWCKHCGASWKP